MITLFILLIHFFDKICYIDFVIYQSFPKISIIIPHLSEIDGKKLLHREEGLKRCIDSIKKQTYDQSLLEIIVHDGLGTVPEKVEQCLKRSTGEFIVFAANDMEFAADAIELAWKDSVEHDVSLVAFNGGSLLRDEGNICEHFLIRKDFVTQLESGQIFSTDFHHVGCDNWLWAQAKKMNQSYRSERAKMVHHHFSKTGNPQDDVYKKGWANLSKDRDTLKRKLDILMKQERIYTNNWFEIRISNFEQFISRFSGRQLRGLEVGSFEGRSANWIVENWCTHPDSSLTCVDPFTGSVEHSDTEKDGLFERFTRNISDNAGKIRVVRDGSHEALQKMIASGEKFDFIYIDGDHHRDAVAKDAELAHQILSPGGLIIFDDYTWGSGMESWQRPKDAIDRFFEKMKNHYDVVIKNSQVFAWKKDIDPIKKRPKIAVYAISKNESKFVERFCESCKDADLIVITDTGSTDDTVTKARELGVVVHSVSISPWRFDIARNCSIALIPSDVDVCVNLDLDEVLEPGWREEIEKLWKPETTRMRYLFDWGSNIRFMSNKIHSRKGYMWKHPCHELLIPDPRTEEVFVHTEKLMVRHMPDPTKSRGQYIDLLEIGVKEDPTCPRNSFYYARELTFYNRHEDALRELKRYLELPTATWVDERAFAMRLLGNTYMALGNNEEALIWYIKGTETAPHRKESWFALAEFCYKTSRWDMCYEASLKCIELPKSNQWPTDSRTDGPQPYDVAAIAAYRLRKNEESIKYGRIALEMAPADERLKTNMKWYLGEM